MFITPLFRQYFASFFLFILIPTFVASVLTYSFVVGLIEDELEKSNQRVIADFSGLTDSQFRSMQRDMINLLGGSNLRNYLKVAGSSTNSRQRMEMAHDLMNQMRIFGTDGIEVNAFLFFADHDLILDKNTYTNKDYYFQQYFSVSGQHKEDLLASLTGKKIMHVTKPFSLGEKVNPSDPNLSTGSTMSVITSYPFNRAEPDVYLVASLDQNKLSDIFHLREDWITAVGIVDSSGNVIGHSGGQSIEPGLLQKVVGADSVGTKFHVDRNVAISYVKSQFNPEWYYFSVVDLHSLMKPAHLIRWSSIWFLGFFLIVGCIASYMLSRKMYTPILEIKTGLDPRSGSVDRKGNMGNDFDIIKHFSRFLQTENKELAQRVVIMTPMIHEQFVSRILLGEFRDRFSIELYAKEINLPFDHRKSSVVYCIDLKFYDSVHLSGSRKTFMLAELKENIAKVLRETVWFCSPEMDVMVCVVHRHRFKDEEVREVAVKIQGAMEPYVFYFKAAIGVGTVGTKVEDLSGSYSRAMMMLKQKGLHPGIEICNDDTAAEDRMNWERFLTHEEVNRMINLYKARNNDMLLEAAMDMLDEGVSVNATESQTKNLIFDILNMWIKLLETVPSDSGFSYFSSLFERLEKCVTWEECRTCLRDIHELLFQPAAVHELQEQFDEVLQYIHEHYGEGLSIEQFSQELGMSAGHFSRTFKEVVGEKYVDYLTKYRMMKAKQLLIDTDLKVDEIAERIGYYGRNSFTRVFSRSEGVTPGTYRNTHRK